MKRKIKYTWKTISIVLSVMLIALVLYFIGYPLLVNHIEKGCSYRTLEAIIETIEQRGIIQEVIVGNKTLVCGVKR